MPLQIIYTIFFCFLLSGCTLTVDKEQAEDVAEGVTEGILKGARKGLYIDELITVYKFVKDQISPPSSVSHQIEMGKPLDSISYRPKIGYNEKLPYLPINEDSLLTASSNSLVWTRRELAENQPFQILESSMNRKLNQEGKGLYGINEDGSVYSVHFAQTGVSSSTKNSAFIDSRNIALRKAELLAKIDILATLAGASITSATEFSSLENEIYQTIQSGIATQSNSVIESEETFSELITENYAGLLLGCEVLKIVEGEIGVGDYQVATCVKFSPDNFRYAVNSDFNLDQPALLSLVRERINDLQEEALIPELGSRVYFFSGNPIVVGFGQAGVSIKNSNGLRRARAKAELRAKNAISSFLGESLVGIEKLKSEESTTRQEASESSSESNLAESFTNSTYQQFDNLIKSNQSTVGLKTITLRYWQSKHPVNHEDIVGAVVVLRQSNLDTGSNILKNPDRLESGRVFESEVKDKIDR